MQRDPRAFLWDAQCAAEAIAQFTAGLDAAGYRASPLIRSAVERQFEIIGELTACPTSGRSWAFAMC
jgi:uncharacterized protein with HEPN domain